MLALATVLALRIGDEARAQQVPATDGPAGDGAPGRPVAASQDIKATGDVSAAPKDPDVKRTDAEAPKEPEGTGSTDRADANRPTQRVGSSGVLDDPQAGFVFVDPAPRIVPESIITAIPLVYPETGANGDPDAGRVGKPGGAASLLEPAAEVEVPADPVNSAPVITSAAFSPILSETDSELATAGEIKFSDADAGDKPTASLGAQTVTSDKVTLTEVQAAAIKSGLVLSADGSWTFKLASPDYLPAGAKIVLVSTVTVSDGKGGTASQDVTITINGANDAAVIGNAGPNGVTEDVGVSNGKLSVSGQLSITDADTGEAFFSTVVISAAGNLGTLVLGRDGQYTYAVDNSLVQYLRASETRTKSFTVTSADGTQKVISFVITGADDPTTITGPGSGAVAEAGGVDNWTSPDAFASGALTVSGDQGAAFVPVDEPTASANGYGVYFMTAGGEWTYRVDNFNHAVEALNVGDTLTDSFIVRTTDGVTKTITITIIGTNDAAFINGIDFGDVTEKGNDPDQSASDARAEGQLTAADVDNVPNTFRAQTDTRSAYGTFNLRADGSWTYVLDDAASAVQALKGGSHVVDRFRVVSIDGTEDWVDVTIHGTNDAAIVSFGQAAAGPGYTEGGNAVSFASGLTIADADSDTMSGATISIANGKSDWDMLNFIAQHGITGSFNASTSTLTLSGTATRQQYEDVLHSVTYSSKGAVLSDRNPDAIRHGRPGTRKRASHDDDCGSWRRHDFGRNRHGIRLFGLHFWQQRPERHPQRPRWQRHDRWQGGQ